VFGRNYLMVVAPQPLARRKLHIMSERDVGLFSLIQQVIATIPWALQEGRIPIPYFGERTCYWRHGGYGGSDTVWEYYFEPVVAGYPVARIPEDVRTHVSLYPPSQAELGYFIDENTFVSSQFGDHPDLAGKALSIPYRTGSPGNGLRRRTSNIICEYVRPRAYIEDQAREFFDEHMRGWDVIGVHVRGTDAVSEVETRRYRQGSLDLPKYRTALRRLVQAHPQARILVTTDAESSLNYLREELGDRVIAYPAIRHQGGQAAGVGPTGCLMPGYIAADRDRAARNGAEALIEYRLLSQCRHLVHNGASLATTVLLTQPTLPHTNVHGGRH
jgi:hypothetical protein